MCISNTGFYRPISTAKNWHNGLQLQPTNDGGAAAYQQHQEQQSTVAPKLNNPLLLHLNLKQAPTVVTEPALAAPSDDAFPFDDITEDELNQLLEPRHFAEDHTHQNQQEARLKPAPEVVAPAPAPLPASSPSVVSLSASPTLSPVLAPTVAAAQPNVALQLVAPPPVAAAALPPAKRKKKSSAVISRPPQGNYVPPCVSSGDGHIIVQHNYHDHADDSPTSYETDLPARGGVTTPFPLKLHEMLACGDREAVISWQPHGRCFVVHKPKEFCELVLPRFFKLSKLASFQRQLNLYGFQRLTRGRDRGGYYHELFLRDRVYLAHAIVRSKVKGTGVRARSNPEQEPNFWCMPWVMPDQARSVEKPPLPATSSSSSEMMMTSTNSTETDGLEQQPWAQTNNSSSTQQQQQQPDALQQLQQITAQQLCQKLEQHQRQQQDNDLGIVFGDRPFHILGQQQQPQVAANLDAIPLDLDFDDDQAFGNLLEGVVFNNNMMMM